MVMGACWRQRALGERTPHASKKAAQRSRGRNSAREVEAVEDKVLEGLLQVGFSNQHRSLSSRDTPRSRAGAVQGGVVCSIGAVVIATALRCWGRTDAAAAGRQAGRQAGR